MDGLIFGRKEKNNEFEQQLSSNERMQQNEMTAQESAAEQYLIEQREKMQDLTKWQQDMSPFLKRMVHDLKREYIGDDGEYHPVIVNGSPLKPLCSDELIQDLISQLRNFTSQNTMMSNLDEYQINKIIRHCEKTVILDMLVPEMKKYGTPEHQLSQIKKIFRGALTPTLYRAWRGGERKHLGTIRTVKELVNEGGQIGEHNKKKGLWGS